MTTRIKAAILAVVATALIALPCTAFANTIPVSSNWNVTFNSNAQMVDDYSAKTWADDISGLQPGDDLTFEVKLHHQHDTTCDWYMSNEVLKSLEEKVASGSAYDYVLTYYNPKGEARELYNSTRVGGTNSADVDSSQGLKEATDALDDWFYLDSLSKGQDARVTVHVALDGETEGNAYFDTLAQLKMKFAVELNQPNQRTTTTNNVVNRNIVQTGDETNLFPFYIAMAVSGALLLVLGFVSLRSRRKEREGSDAR